jgi:hypothetical protein
VRLVTFDEMEKAPPPTTRGPPTGGPRRAPPRPPLPDFDRADAIGTFWSYQETRAVAELLIHLEEDKATRWVVFGLLAEMDGTRYRMRSQALTEAESAVKVPSRHHVAPMTTLRDAPRSLLRAPRASMNPHVDETSAKHGWAPLMWV